MNTSAVFQKEARILIQTLRRHGVRASIQGMNPQQEGVQFYLRLESAQSVDDVRQLAGVLARATGRPRCDVTTFDDLVVLSMAPRLQPLFLADVWSTVLQLAPGTALPGTTTEDRPLRLRMDNPDVVPLLISGGSGVGKTTLARSIALTLALGSSPRDWRLTLITGLRREGFTALSELPHIWHPDRASRGAHPLIEIVEALIEAPAESRRTAVLVVIDDVEDILAVTGSAGRAALSWLLAEGPDRNVFCVVVSRRVHKLTPTVRAHFALHLTGRPPAGTPLPAQVDTLDETLYPRLPGEFVLLGTASGPLPLRAVWAGQETLKQVVTWYRRRHPTVLVKRDAIRRTDEARRTPVETASEPKLPPELTFEE